MAEARYPGLKRLLDAVYGASSSLAAVFLAAIAAIVIGQIVSRAVGVKIVGLDEFAAWSMGAAVFLALPNTLVRGGHIRVSLVVDRLPHRAACGFDVVAALLGVAVSAWAAWSVTLFVWNSYRLGDLTQGELSMPLWPPQLTMAAGFALLAVAFVECLVRDLARLVGGEGRPRRDATADGEGL